MRIRWRYNISCGLRIVARTAMEVVSVAALSLFSSLAAAAQDTCVYQCKLESSAQYAAADVLGNLYLIDGFDVLKFDSTGRKTAKYSNNRLETSHFLDVSNPMKILVWYDYFQTIVFLDRNMTELGRLNLGDAGLPLAVHPAMAGDGNLWVYDLNTYRLLKISPSGELLRESPPLTLLGPGIAEALLDPVGICENGEQVFLGLANKGVIRFDIFAQNPQLIYSSACFDRFVLQDREGIAACVNGVLFRFNTERPGFEPPKVLKCRIDTSVFWLSRRKVFVERKGGLEVYRY